MASKKNLKKDLNYLTNELLTECFTYQFFHVDMDPKQANEVAAFILNNRNDLANRINNIENKDNPKLVKEHFKKIRSDFEKSVEALDKLIAKK
jgi:capsule polysaccharide export protein KpsE/RkpR